MKKCEKIYLKLGLALLFLFALWTLLVCAVDVQLAGVNSTEVGLAKINVWFHSVTGVNMDLYTLTDWLGLVPVGVCFFFGIMGFFQLLKRKSLLKVDCDIILSGAYYIVVFACYFLFEIIVINYRPVLIDGRMEASYPSSTTLLVLSVMPTLMFEAKRRLKNSLAKRAVLYAAAAFSAFTVIGRLLSGVHWLTDIVGSVILSAGLFFVYKSVVLLCDGIERSEYGV